MGFEAKFVKLIKKVLNFEPFMTSSKQKLQSAKMTFLEEILDIQNCLAGKSYQLNSRSRDEQLNTQVAVNKIGKEQIVSQLSLDFVLQTWLFCGVAE